MKRDFIKTMKVGQEVVISLINDSIRYLRYNEGITLDNIDKWTKKGVITKIGRKLITVNIDGFKRKYDSTTYYEETHKYGSADSRLYESIDEIVKEYKYNGMWASISNKFSGYSFNRYLQGSLSYDVVEKIYNLIKEEG